jgi:hypothetical protein
MISITAARAVPRRKAAKGFTAICASNLSLSSLTAVVVISALSHLVSTLTSRSQTPAMSEISRLMRGL